MWTYLKRTKKVTGEFSVWRLENHCCSRPIRTNHSFSQSEKRIFNRPCFTVWAVLVVYWFVLIKCFQFSWDLPTLKSFFWEWETRNSRPVILYTESNRIKLLSPHFPIIYRHLTVEQTAGHRQPTHCMNLKSAG